MFIHRLNYDAPDTGSGGGSDILDKQGIFDALSDDKLDVDDDKEKLKIDELEETDEDDDDSDEDIEDKKNDKKEKKKDDKKDKKEDKEIDDLDELEKELEEEDNKEDKEEELEITSPLRRKEVLAKYPKLFEEFPQLERAYYRNQKYSELLPTIEDAKEAVEAKETLEGFEEDLVNGNIEKMLLATKEGSGQGFNKLVDNYLSVLQKVDPNSALHVIKNVISNTIYQMATEARESKNEELHKAAKLLNEFIFGTSKYVAPSKLTTEDKTDPEKDKLETEKKQFAQQKFESASNDVRTKVSNLLKSAIADYIDPKNSMPPYVKKNAQREAFEYLNQMLTEDKRFRGIIDKLWERAAKSNYSNDSVMELRKAFLGRGKSLLPTAIKKARLEALKGMRINTKETKDDDTDDTDKNEKPNRQSREKKDKSQSTKPSDKFAGMSTLEALMSDD